MKKLTQGEWVELHNNVKGGFLGINGVNISRDGTIASLEITTRLSGTLSSWGELEAKYVGGIEGGVSRQFVLEENGTVSLVLGCEEKLHNKVCKPITNFVVPMMIPYEKWLADYIAVQNFTHKRDEDKFHEVRITGMELNGKGVVRRVNSDVTWEEVYGCFGRNTSYDRKIEAGRDVLTFTYGLCRNDICDEWEPSSSGYKWHCYFDENLNLWYDGDTSQFYYNRGYNNDYFNGYHHEAYRIVA